MTQAKSLIGALVLGLVSSGALTAILQSCQDCPTVTPGAVTPPRLPPADPTKYGGGP